MGCAVTKDIYIVCGVPGAGKTWVCKQVSSLYTYVPRDAHLGDDDNDLVRALRKAAATSHKPVLTECPFGERPLKARLELCGYTVHPVFVVEHVSVVRARYAPRGRMLPRGHATRAGTIERRADEWKAPKGTSAEIARYLALVPKVRHYA